MAYAQLADLPAYFGLYAAFLPPIVAALFGSSRQLATGPVAVVSLMTATALAPFATAGSAGFIQLAILLALLVGLFQLSLGVLRLGLVVNFLSHPVVNGFTNAAALIIASSQLDKLFGVEAPKAEHQYEFVYNTFIAIFNGVHYPTVVLAGLAILIMVLMKKLTPRVPNVLAAVFITTLISYWIGFEANVKTDITKIQDIDAVDIVANYNNSLERCNQLVDHRVLMQPNLRKTVRQHGKRSPEAIEARMQIDLLELEIESAKEHSNLLRERIRALRFVERVDSIQGVHFIRLEDVSSKERAFRFKVGAGSVNDTSVVLIGGGMVVGSVPKGIPSFQLPKIGFSAALDLLPMAIIISLLGFMEAISIAKAMAARTGQRLDPNQELIGQGLANIVGSFNQGYPVSGSFSRSAVSLQSGAVTGMGNVFASFVVFITLLFFTPLLYHLPQSVLAAVIMMAVVGLLNVRGFIHAWHAQKFDGVISMITFITTLAFAPHLDRGIMVGVVLSLGLYLLRNMHPDISLLSKAPDGSYRNADRNRLEKCRHIAVVRFNNSLFFANVNYLEEKILEQISQMPTLKRILIVGNGINELDASGEVLISQLVGRLRESGLDIMFSGLNDHVLDVMKRTHLYDKIGTDHFFPSVAAAVRQIHKSGVCLDDDRVKCPLVESTVIGFEIDPAAIKKMQEQDQ